MYLIKKITKEIGRPFAQARQRMIRLIARDKNFKSSAYWENRYLNGGNSGAGSYNRLAEFKAEILNTFVEENNIERVIEFGSGDGNQLALLNFKHYIGVDVSPTVIKLTREKFAGDSSKIFLHMDEYSNQTAELAISLDVIYHLIEDSVFDSYMRRLFAAAEKFVIIYSSNYDSEILPKTATHVKHRKFHAWVLSNLRNWKLMKYIPNRYPLSGPDDPQKENSFSDFYIYAHLNCKIR